MSERDIEIREIMEHPAFKDAVLQVLEQVLTPVVQNITEKYGKFFVFRAELKSRCFKKGNIHGG